MSEGKHIVCEVHPMPEHIRRQIAQAFEDSRGRFAVLPDKADYRWSPLSRTVAALWLTLGFILGTMFGSILALGWSAP